MSNWLSLGLVVILIGGLMMLTTRNRRRQLEADADRAAAIDVGTDVMTTSGLYGTVVARNEDDSVQLSIAPGVEVRWAVAALRDVADLPDRYRPADSETTASNGESLDSDAEP